MNSVNLVGRMVADPELRYSQSGKAVCKFRIAIGKFGKKDEANFIDCVCFDKIAENVANYMSKGREVSVNGTLENQKSYEKEGQKVYPKDVVIARQVGFIGGGGGNGQAQGQGSQATRPAAAAPARPVQTAQPAQQAFSTGFDPSQIDLAEFESMDDDEGLPF